MDPFTPSLSTARLTSSYAYLFIMDPVIKGADYEIESLLKKEYGVQKGNEYFKLFKDAIIEKNVKDYRVIQSTD